jgi:hypothetical protein
MIRGQAPGDSPPRNSPDRNGQRVCSNDSRSGARPDAKESIQVSGERARRELRLVAEFRQEKETATTPNPPATRGESAVT